MEALILFDGVCNLCNSSVNFVIDRDAKKKFKFASLQSDTAAEIMTKHQIPIGTMESILLVKDGKVYNKSAAVLRIAVSLGGIWSIFHIFRVIPPPIGDWVYNIVAKYRYRWFGRSDQCRIPSEEIMERFI